MAKPSSFLKRGKKMTNYEIGRELEYLVMKILKKELKEPKYQIIRTAGSHSSVDIVVLENRGRRFVGIQCKSRKVPKPKAKL